MRFIACCLLLLAAGTFSAPVQATSSLDWSVARLSREVPAEAFREVTSGRHAANFTPVSAERIVREGRGAMWLRVTIERDLQSGEPFVLALRDARNSRVTHFPPAGMPRAQSVWSEEPSPRFARDALYFPLGASLRSGEVHYLLVDRPSGGADLPMALGLDEMAEVNAANLRHSRAIASIIGGSLVLGLLSLGLWLWLRERSFLYYGGTTTMGALYLAFFFGEGFAWFGFSAGSLLAFSAIAVPGAVGIAFNLLLFRELLDLPRNSPRVGLAILGFAVLFFALGALLFAATGDLQRLLVTIANLAAFVVTIVMLYPLSIASARGNRVARILFGAWGLTQLVVLWRVASLLRGDPHSPELYYGFPLALLAGDMLKAWALAERMRLQRTGRDFVLTNAGAKDEYEAIVERLRVTCRQSRASGRPTAVLKVQIDNAARIAASHGKAVLAACLTILRSRVRHGLRDDDALGAVGESELLVVLPGASPAAAAKVAERIRARATAERLHSDGTSLALTVSVGLAWSQGAAEAEALMAQADAALATADTAGGNQVVELPA